MAFHFKICLFTLCLIFFNIISTCHGKILRSITSTQNNEDSLSCSPYEIHIGVTNDNTQMRVTWRTNGTDCSNEITLITIDPDFISSCKIVDNINNKDCKILNQQNIKGIAYDSDQTLFCGPVASYTEYEAHYHSVILPNLIPGNYYYYKLPTSEKIYRFKASLSAGDSRDFIFYGFGDMGESIDPESSSTGADFVMQSMLKEGIPDLVLHVGDISYANGRHFIWDNFMVFIEQMAANVPWMITNGNHEYVVTKDVQKDPWGITPYNPDWGTFDGNDSGGECGLQIFWKFPFDNFSDQCLISGKDSNGYLLNPAYGEAFPPFYYSFDYGSVHFVALSSEHSSEPGSGQRIWLENDLSGIDRCETPFIIILLHRPFYYPMFEPDGYSIAMNLLNIYEPLLKAYKVDLVISGHVHAYYSVNTVKCDNDDDSEYCVKSVIIGTAGHHFSYLTLSSLEVVDNLITLKWGFGKFEVKGKDRIEMSFITSKDNEVEDKITFKNQRLCLVS